ncbi:MAG: LTA synthase family protein [Clostridium sp.]
MKEDRVKQGILQKGKEILVNGFNNKSFNLNLIGMILKTILFVVLIYKYSNVGEGFFKIIPPVLLWIAVLAPFLSIGFLFKGKTQKNMFWILNILFTTLVIGDIWYFRSNGRFLSLFMLGMTDNLSNLGEALFGMTRVEDLLFLVDIVIIGYLNFKSRKVVEKIEKNRVATVVITVVCLIYIGVINVIYTHDKIDEKVVFGWSGTGHDDMFNFTPVGYHLAEFKSFYEESKPFEFSKNEKQEAENTISSLKENNEDNRYKGMFNGKNLIVIQWESLENFVVGQRVNGQEITPNLNKLIQNSLYFNNYHEQTDGGTSSDGELITNTSVLPIYKGAAFYRFSKNEYKNSLPNIFKELGYNNLVSHPDNGAYWNWYENLESIGYDELYDESDYNVNERINMGLSDGSYLKQFSEVIKDQKEPYLAFTITLTSHTPFNIPKELYGLNLPKELEGTKLGDYFQAINYTDRCIGEFMDALDSAGVLEDTVVAFYGDHEGVSRYFGDELKGIDNLEDWMVSNNKRVPLVIYNKGMEGELHSVLGGQVDFLPTISYLFGAVKELYNSNLTIGRNLLNTNMDYVLLQNGELLQNGLSEEQINAVKKTRDISDKMIRGNYFK